MRHTIESAAYHRNGVSGEGFYVGVARCTEEGETHRMLVTFFPEFDDQGEPLPAGKDAAGHFTNPRVAVVALDLLDDHGVTFGVNSWRGDHYCDVANAIVRAVNGERCADCGAHDPMGDEAVWHRSDCPRA